MLVLDRETDFLSLSFGDFMDLFKFFVFWPLSQCNFLNNSDSYSTNLIGNNFMQDFPKTDRKNTKLNRVLMKK